MNFKHSTITTALCLSLLSMTAVSAKMEVDYKVAREGQLSVPQGLQAEQPRVEYIWPEVQPSVNLAPKQQVVTSDYYWQVVTGEELKRGVKLYVSSGDALLRIAPKADMTSGVRVTSRALDMSKLSLSESGGNTLAVRQMASVEAMKLAGFDDGSVALQLPEVSNEMLLRSEQRLAPKSQYLLQVKEKHSPYKLQVNAANALVNSDAFFPMELTMMGESLDEAQTKVQLLSQTEPSTELTYRNGGVELPQTLSQVGAFAGLYELQLTTTQSVNGKMIKRSAKIPFAQHIKTAELSGELKRVRDSLYLPVEVYEPGRYSIVATLQGQDSNGNDVRMQTAEVAQWLATSQDMRLPFDLAQFDNGFGAFSVVNVQLKDQSRMMPLQTMAEVHFSEKYLPLR